MEDKLNITDNLTSNLSDTPIHIDPIDPIDPITPVGDTSYLISFSNMDPTELISGEPTVFHMSVTKVQGKLPVVVRTLPNGFYIRGYLDSTSSLNRLYNGRPESTGFAFPISISSTSAGTHSLIVTLEEDTYIQHGEIIELITITHATDTRTISIAPPKSNYYVINDSISSSLEQLLKDKQILKSNNWPHTVGKDIKDYYNFSGISDYAIVVNDDATESPLWDEAAINTGYYFKYNSQDKELKFLPKDAVYSFLHNLNKEWSISDNIDLDKNSLSAIAGSISSLTAYYLLKSSSDNKQLILIKYDQNQNPIDEWTKNASDFEYKSIPTTIYLAGCGAGASGTPSLTLSNDDNFVSYYFESKFANTFAAGGGSGASLLIGLRLNGNNQFYLKVGLGGLFNSNNKNRCGQPTIISTTIQGLSNWSDSQSEVIVLEGGIQMEQGNWSQYSALCYSMENFYNYLVQQSPNKREPTICYYNKGVKYVGTSYKVISNAIKNNSKAFIPVPLPDNSNIYRGKLGPIISWGRGYGLLYKFYRGEFHRMTDKSTPVGTWDATILDPKVWKLPGVDISNLYKTYPDETKDNKYAGPYFTLTSEVIIGGAPSCFGDGGSADKGTAQGRWPSLNGFDPLSYKSLYNSYVNLESISTSLSSIDYPRKTGYGAGGYGDDSNDSFSFYSPGGNGCIFLYY